MREASWSFRTYALQFGVAALAVVVCLWAATQWAAAMLGHQAALGPARIDAVGLKIYAPWHLFVWWSAFDAQAPDVFARACILAAFSGLARVGTIVAADSVRLETKHNAEIAEQRFDLTSETSAQRAEP